AEERRLLGMERGLVDARRLERGARRRLVRAALLVLLAAPAGTRIVPPDLGPVAPHGVVAADHARDGIGERLSNPTLPARDRLLDRLLRLLRAADERRREVEEVLVAEADGGGADEHARLLLDLVPREAARVD